MRIGYILNIFPKLSETFVINEIIELMERGHEINIFSLARPSERIVQPEVKAYNLTSKTHYLPFASKVVSSLISTLSSDALIGKNQILAARKVYCGVAARFFSQIAKRLDLDIIHAHFANWAAYVAMLMSKYTGIPFTFTAHAIDIFDRPDVYLLREMAAKSSAIVTISYFNRNYLHKLTGADLGKIHVVRACVSNKFRDFQWENGKEKNSKRILTVARLVETKGIIYGILAVKKLIQSFPNIEYRIVGSGPLKAKLNSLVKSLNLENNVRLTGELEASLLVDEYRKAKLFILPCVRTPTGDMDGIPVSLMEAMYLGIPVISTNISGIPELIDNGKSGLLVEEKNVEQLAKAIEILLRNEDLASRIGREARKKIETCFNIHNEARKLLCIWSKIRNLAEMET
jgi:glycosyltransferase involved in cell wall biosynthesis